MERSFQRVYFLDYLRVIACFLVLVVHASEQYYGAGNIPVATQDIRLWMGIWDGIARVSVPLFMICSAYLLAPLAEDQSWGDFSRRRAVGLVNGRGPHRQVWEG